MSIDLTNSESLRGAVDALKTILKSRKRPLVVTQNSNGGGGGAQLQLPKNVKIKPTNSDSQDSQKPTEPQQSQNSNSSQGSQNAMKADQPKDTTSGAEGAKSNNDNQNPIDEMDPLDELDDSESTEERQARLDRIQKSLEDDEIQKDIEEIRQDTALRNSEILRAKKDALDQLTKQINGKELQPFSSFSVDLFKAINSQVKKAKHKEDTYRRPNPSYAGTDYLMPGKDYPDKKEIPVIAVYFDQSGSWDSSDIKKGIQALASIRQFEVQKKIKLKLFYFANTVHDNPMDAQREGSTHAFPKILKHISNPANKITNVIVISDSDIENQTSWANCSETKVRGCVWFLWKDGSRSRTAPRYLKGECGNFEYNLQ